MKMVEYAFDKKIYHVPGIGYSQKGLGLMAFDSHRVENDLESYLTSSSYLERFSDIILAVARCVEEA